MRNPAVPPLALAAALLLAASAAPAMLAAPAAEAQPATAAAPGGVAPAASAPTPPTSPAASRLAPCTVEDTHEPALCGTYPVWEDREAKRGRKISLNVLVLPALEGMPPGGSAFTFLDGGPGAAATRVAAGFMNDKELRRHRDILLVDQRGTGRSNPLNCDFHGPGSHSKGASDPRLLAGELFPPEAVRACRDELSKVADLKLYTTALGMDDVDDVRTWLGYPKLDIEGGSYGTRAAQVYMRRHPAAVRSVVLDGVAPVDEPIPLHHAYAGQRAIDLLFAECAAQPACHAAFPDLPTELRAVIARAEHGVTVRIADPRTGKPVEVTADRGTIAEGLRFMMYGRTARQVPLAVHRAYEGDLAQLVTLAIQRRAELDHVLSMGMNFSVTCAEDLPFIDAAATARLTVGTMLGDYRIREQKRVCELWPRGAISADAREPVRSDLPVLLISGERDPVTPPEFGERVARWLPNGRLVVVPHSGHGADGACAQRVVNQFVERASVQGLDASCLMATPPPHFQTKMPVAVMVPDNVLDSYAGTYELPFGRLTVARRDGHLVLQSPGQPDTEIFPDSPSHFFSRTDDLDLEFVPAAAGGQVEMVVHDGPQAIHGRRVGKGGSS